MAHSLFPPQQPEGAYEHLRPGASFQSSEYFMAPVSLTGKAQVTPQAARLCTLCPVTSLLLSPCSLSFCFPGEKHQAVLPQGLCMGCSLFPSYPHCSSVAFFRPLLAPALLHPVLPCFSLALIASMPVMDFTYLLIISLPLEMSATG